MPGGVRHTRCLGAHIARESKVNLEPRLARQQEQSGQALVEFALVLVFVILPFMFVLTDGAFTLYTYAMLTNAAREGARAASIYQTSTLQSGPDVCAYRGVIDAERVDHFRQDAQRLAGTLVSFQTCVVQPPVYVPDDPSDACTKSPETIDAFREMQPISWQLDCPRRLFFGLIGTSQITLTAQATMRVEPGGVATGP